MFSVNYFLQMFLLGFMIGAAALASIYVTSDHTSYELFNLPEFLSTWSHQFWDYFQRLSHGD